MSVIAQAEDQTDDAQPNSDLTEAEQAFQDQMQDAVLVGFFSLADNLTAGGKPERYEIRSIRKMSDRMWMFRTRVKYGNVDTVVPIIVPVEWAGDTPMVSLTDFTIPGLGTFSCRVLFHKDRYAGTWQHGDKGGHMWGMIEKNETSEDHNGKKSKSRSRP